jgi:potassium/hydrogen antiporter
MPQDAVVAFASVLVLVAVAATRLSSRLGIPALALFVGVGMLAGENGPGGVDFDDYGASGLVGNVALAVILFAGGFSTKAVDAARVAAPACALSTIGVAATAGVVALSVRTFTNATWLEALLLGAVVSSTDAAAVFSALRGKGVPPRLRMLLEVESGTNDPVANILVVALTEATLVGGANPEDLALFLTRQIGIGALVGYGTGRAAAFAVNRLRLESAGLYPVFALAAGVASYATANVGFGNGFLSVYVAGLVFGSAKLAHRTTIARFLDGAASLAQVCVFLLLGLLSTPERLASHAGAGLAIAATLVFLARPIAVFATLLPAGLLSPAFRFRKAELALVAWSGLRGAVPIIFAIYPLLRGTPRGEELFDVVFFVVLASVLLQGPTVARFAKRLGLLGPTRPPSPASLEFAAGAPVDVNVFDFTVERGSPADARSIAEIALPDDAVVSGVLRDGRIFPARGATRLAAGDHVFVLAKPDADVAANERLAALFVPPPPAPPAPPPPPSGDADAEKAPPPK